MRTRKPEVIENLSNLLELKNDLNQLAAGFRFPSLRFEWIFAAAEALPAEDKLKIVVTRDSQGSIEAIAPMVIVGSSGKKDLTFLANRFVSESAGPIFKDTDSLHRLLAVLSQIGIPMSANRIPQEILKQIDTTRILMQHALPIKRPDSSSPLVKIDCSWEAFEEKLSSRRRSDLRRAWRKAQQSGDLSFQMITPEPEDVADWMRKFYLIEENSWKASAGSALYQDDLIKKFFLSLIRQFAGLKASRFSIMMIGEQIVAGQIGLQYAGSFWVLKIAYSDQYKNCSPGIVLMHETLREAFDQKLDAFEFLGVEEAWMKFWETDLSNYGKLDLYPYNINGTTAFLGQTFSALKRRIYGNLSSSRSPIMES